MTLAEQVQAIEYQVVEIRQLVAQWSDPDPSRAQHYEQAAAGVYDAVVRFKNDLLNPGNNANPN